MSGYSKRIVYEIVLAVCLSGALAGCALLDYYAFDDCDVLSFSLATALFVAVCLIAPLNVCLHEAGHLLFGFCAGMRFYAVSLGHLRLSRGGAAWSFLPRHAGETQMIPKKSNGVRARTAAFALGGAILNFVYGGIFLALYFLVPVTPALLFFELFAPLNLFEGIVALFPVTLPSGRTDGEVLRGLLRKTPEAEIRLGVSKAQGLLYHGGYEALPSELLFNLPVIAEDDPAFIALLCLRWRYLYAHGDGSGAVAVLDRLQTLVDYMGEGDAASVAAERGLVLLIERDGAEISPESEGKGSADAILEFYRGRTTREQAEKVIKKEFLEGERKLFLKLLDAADEKKKNFSPRPTETHP